MPILIQPQRPTLAPAQRRAYLIGDNRIAEQAGWDRALLAIELGELVELLPIEGCDISGKRFKRHGN